MHAKICVEAAVSHIPTTVVSVTVLFSMIAALKVTAGIDVRVQETKKRNCFILLDIVSQNKLMYVFSRYEIKPLGSADYKSIPN